MGLKSTVHVYPGQNPLLEHTTCEEPLKFAVQIAGVCFLTKTQFEHCMSINQGGLGRVHKWSGGRRGDSEWEVSSAKRQPVEACEVQYLMIAPKKNRKF